MTPTSFRAKCFNCHEGFNPERDKQCFCDKCEVLMQAHVDKNARIMRLEFKWAKFKSDLRKAKKAKAEVEHPGPSAIK